MKIEIHADPHEVGAILKSIGIGMGQTVAQLPPQPPIFTPPQSAAIALPPTPTPAPPQPDIITVEAIRQAAESLATRPAPQPEPAEIIPFSLPRELVRSPQEPPLLSTNLLWSFIQNYGAIALLGFLILAAVLGNVRLPSFTPAAIAPKTETSEPEKPRAAPAAKPQANLEPTPSAPPPASPPLKTDPKGNPVVTEGTDLPPLPPLPAIE